MTSKFTAFCLGLALAGASGVHFSQAAQGGTSDSDLAYQLALDAGRIETMVAKAEDTADRILADKMPKEPANMTKRPSAT